MNLKIMPGIVISTAVVGLLFLFYKWAFQIITADQLTATGLAVVVSITFLFSFYYVEVE